MAVVEGIEHRPRRGAAGKTVPLATLLHRQERLAVIGLEHQQVIGASFQDLVGDRLLAAHGVQGHDAVLQRQRLEQRWDRGWIAVISFDLPSTSCWPRARPCSLAQALTRCSGPCARPRSKERRRVLPSMATTSRSKASAKD